MTFWITESNTLFSQKLGTIQWLKDPMTEIVQLPRSL